MTKPTQEMFAGFDPDKTIETLIDVSSKGALAGLPGGEVLEAIQARGAEDGLNVIRKIGAVSALRFEIPALDVDRFKELYTIASKISAIDLVRNTALVRELSSLVTSVLGQVPYLRFVVQVGSLIANLLSYAGRKPDIPPDTALAYKPGNNEFAFDVLVDRVRGGDWTSIFEPCQDLPTWQTERILEVSEMPGFLGRGMRIEAAGAFEGACDGLGLLPGLTEQDGGIYEYPFEMPPNPDGLVLGQGPLIETYGPKGLSKIKGGMGWPTTPINTTGALRPMMRQAAASVWQRAMRPSIESFQIDTRKIAEKWGTFYASLRETGEMRPGRSGHQIGVQAISASIAAKVRWTDEGLFVENASRFEGISFSKLDIKVRPRALPNRNDGLHNIAGLEYVIYRMTEKLRAVQHYALSRTTVAYVSPDAPALRDSALRERHVEMRSKLLDHPAICNVELDMIPDRDYRSQATEAQHRMRCFLGARDVTAIPQQYVLAALEPIPEPEGAQGGPPGAEEGGGGGAAVVAVIAAAAALLALG